MATCSTNRQLQTSQGQLGYGYWTTAFAGLVFWYGLSCRQDTSIKSWAMSEARARGDADGADVKIGESLLKHTVLLPR